MRNDPGKDCDVETEVRIGWGGRQAASRGISRGHDRGDIIGNLGGKKKEC